MAVTLDYVDLSTFNDVMREEAQAQASDDSDVTDPNQEPTRNDERVKRFLKRAESLADSYIINYERPLDNPPMAFKYAIYVIARYMLLSRSDGSVSDDMQESYNQAINWLKNVRDGVVDLGPDEEEYLEDFVGHATYGDMVFEEYPFVDKSATLRNEAI